MAALPEVVSNLAQRWALQIAQPYEPGGQCSWVAPARTAAGEDLVLKVGWHHPEAAQEADALRLWQGNGAVQLHAAATIDRSSALLLERCSPGTPLGWSAPEPVQDVIVVHRSAVYRSARRQHPRRPA
ncbi:MAG: aminoglycoside phosphotransferase family protein [Pseudonocardiales bacterium]